MEDFPRKQPHFDVVVRLAKSNDLQSYAGSILLLVVSPIPDR